MADHTTYGLVCSELSEDLSKTNLGELKLDSFQDNSVQIKIKAASLNFPDLLMTQGKYQIDLIFHLLLGWREQE